MGESNGSEDAVQHLRDALDAEDAEQKDFHVRQALQLLRVEDE